MHFNQGVYSDIKKICTLLATSETENVKWGGLGVAS